MIEILNRAQLTTPVERLVAHPRLPLIAGVDLTRPAVHVWDLDLRPITTVGAATAGYRPVPAWERLRLSPELVWHPYEPILLVSAGDTLTRWSPTDVTTWSGTYRSLAFSPDGGTLWASPAAGGGDDAWLASDLVDPAGGVVGTGPGWDTGVAEHPAGGLVLTLASDQGATLGLFARAEDRRMRIRSRALVLDVDGYVTPVWSPDGRRFAVRGNSYAQTLEVFSFPELRCQLRITLRQPDQNLATDPTEWALAWLRHDIAFAADPDVLWIGTPHGHLISFDLATDLATDTATEHTVVDTAVTALARTASGQLIVADRDGGLVLLSVPGDHVAPDTDGPAAFLDSTEPIDADGELWDRLELTDGMRTWRDDDRDTVVAADESDPTWLRLQAAFNEVSSRSADEPTVREPPLGP